jgi:putative transposase
LEEAIGSKRAGAFSGRRNGQAKSEEELTAPLYEEIGRLKMDVKWLKKKL